MIDESTESDCQGVRNPVDIRRSQSCNTPNTFVPALPSL